MHCIVVTLLKQLVGQRDFRPNKMTFFVCWEEISKLTATEQITGIITFDLQYSVLVWVFLGRNDLFEFAVESLDCRYLYQSHFFNLAFRNTFFLQFLIFLI